MGEPHGSKFAKTLWQYAKDCFEGDDDTTTYKYLIKASRAIEKRDRKLMVKRHQIRELGAEIAQLRSRLEWREDGHDGIYCRDETIRVLEAEVRSLKLTLDSRSAARAQYLEEKLAAEANLRAVGELRDKWKKYGMEKHWIEWDNSTIFNKCADELEAALKNAVNTKEK